MDDIRYIDLDLNQVDIWKEELDSLDYCLKTFGELGYILHEYYQHYDVSLFNQHKTIIESKLIDYMIGSKPIPVFFGKLEKILMLNKYWDTHNKWRDPLVVRHIGQRNNKPFYYVHPGRDRYCILKNKKVESYRFLFIPSLNLQTENYDLIKSFWGEYSETVVIKPSEHDPSKYVLGNHDTDQYMKFSNIFDWLRGQ